MISAELENLSDRLLGYAAEGSFVPPEVSANMAAVLLDHARIVRVLETLPFDVTVQLLDAIPEGRLARTAVEAQKP